MKAVITGRCKLSSRDVEAALTRLAAGFRQVRFVHSLEKLTVAAAGLVLDSAGLRGPCGKSDIGIFIGIDNSIEDLKDQFFSAILDQGMLGASPMVFPFTSPNSLAARVSIVYDIRGESITIPINHSGADVIKYATDCIEGKYIKMAVAGLITMKHMALSAEEGRYEAEFYFLEDDKSARERNAVIYDCL